MPLSRVAKAISCYGAVPTVELQHAGMYANRDLAVFGGKPHSDAFGPVEYQLDGRTVYEMSGELIEQIIAKYAEAARIAKSCGFGMILIHAGHGVFIAAVSLTETQHP